jgi:hypothetical protein
MTKTPKRKSSVQYKFLTLATIQKFVPLMEKLRVSEVARAPDGFLSLYIGAQGHGSWLPVVWRAKRDGFIARHMAQLIANDEPLYDKEGMPTRRHLALIAWAYSPDPAGVGRRAGRMS